jgi:hypothetical protein
MYIDAHLCICVYFYLSRYTDIDIDWYLFVFVNIYARNKPKTRAHSHAGYFHVDVCMRAYRYGGIANVATPTALRNAGHSQLLQVGPVDRRRQRRELGVLR